MANIELNKRQISYVLLSLNKFENELLNQDNEDFGDELDDVLMIQDLKKIFTHAKEKE